MAVSNRLQLFFNFLTLLGISLTFIMADEACCTCASLLSVISPEYDEKTEKPVAQDRRLDCCGRVICGKCIAVRLVMSYCPIRMLTLSFREIIDLQLTVYLHALKLLEPNLT